MPEAQDSTAFARWFEKWQADPHDPEKKLYNPWTVSQKAGISHVQIGKLLEGSSGTKRKTVEKIAGAVVEILGIDNLEAREKILAEALLAAGYAPISGVIREANEEYLLTELEAYTGSDPRILAAKGAAQGVSAALDNAETVPPSPHLTGEMRRG